MGERGWDNRDSSTATLRCPDCGAPYEAADRYCSECGAVLPLTGAPAQPFATAVATAPSAKSAPQLQPQGDSTLWVFAAPPASVILFGVLLLVLAVILLFVGQLEPTGTIVMLAFVLAPLGLLIIATGLVRRIARAMKRA